jgi:hypothetical protein
MNSLVSRDGLARGYAVGERPGDGIPSERDSGRSWLADTGPSSLNSALSRSMTRTRVSTPRTRIGAVMTYASEPSPMTSSNGRSTGYPAPERSWRSLIDGATKTRINCVQMAYPAAILDRDLCRLRSPRRFPHWCMYWVERSPPNKRGLESRRQQIWTWLVLRCPDTPELPICALERPEDAARFSADVSEDTPPLRISPRA